MRKTTFGHIGTRGFALVALLVAAGCSSSPDIESSSSDLRRRAASANCATLTGTSGSLTDGSGNVWTLVASATDGNVVRENGAAPGYTSQVKQLAYVNGVISQENINDDWWSWTNNAWVATSDPTASCAAPPPSNNSGSGQTASGGTTTSAANPFYGLNGHVQQYVTGSYEAERAVLQDLGVKVYRNDVSDANGATKLAAMANALQGTGITVEAVLLTSFSGTNEQANYNVGFSSGQSIAQKLKGLVTHYECGNELENNLVTSDGNHPADYPSDVWPAIRGVIRGMIDGIKSVDSSAQVAPAAASWLHYGMMEMLWNGTNPDGSGGATPVRWDFTAWHWYSDMQNIENACGGRGCVNVLQKLKDDFGKPIWLTEVGSRPPTAANEAAYVTSVYSQLLRVRGTYGLENASWYNLHDDQSGTFGLIDGNGVHKSAYSVFKNFIAANPL